MMETKEDIFYQLELIEMYVKDESQISVVMAVVNTLRRKLSRLSLRRVDDTPRCHVCQGPLTFLTIHEDKQHNQYRVYECEYCDEQEGFEYELFDPKKPHICRRIED